MEATLKQFFSIGDGRLSTEIGDVYLMLNYIFDDNFFTHQLPEAMRKLIEVNPDWFQKGKDVIEEIKAKNGTNDFAALMKIIDLEYSNYKVKLGKINANVSFTSGL